jgi:hypothetical protein
VLETALLILIGVLSSTGGAAEDPAGGDPAECLELEAAGDPAALQSCRAAFEASPGDLDVIAALADLEFRLGDSARSARLWGMLLEGGWDPDAARGQAMALWRAGRMDEAEAVLRELVELEATTRATVDLSRFLLAMDRPAEASDAVAARVTTGDSSCELELIWGEAMAAVDDHAAAAKHFGASVDQGCPAFAWTRVGRVPGELDQPAYRSLLTPQRITADLDSLDDEQCLERFELLKPVMTAAVAPTVTDQILDRRTAEVRLAGIGLLSGVGSATAESWQRLLLSDDFVLRKHALRRIRQLEDPAFAPMLEDHLVREPLPGNRSLTALALGELLLDGADPDRGVGLLEGIPATDPSYAAARMTLLDRAEEAGDLAAAYGYLTQIRAAAPEYWIDPDREASLASAAAAESGVSPEHETDPADDR